MGTRKKTAKKAASKAAKPVDDVRSGRIERLRNLLFRPKLLLAAALAGAGFVLAPTIQRLIPDISQRPEYVVATTQIQIPDPPRWVPVGFLQQVIEKGDLPAEVSVLEKDLAKKVASAFEKHAWVHGPVEVSVSVPASIRVQFEYRQPVAMVQVSNGFYPVDDHGILLPPQDFPPSELDHYPRISGLRSTPIGGVGSSWGDVRVIAAARLATVLAPWWKDWKLQAIEVPARTTADQKYDDLQFVIATQGGSRILWGRPPGHDHPLEITAEQKIGRLKEFLARGKSFDGPYEININHLLEISRVPLNDSTQK